MTEVIVAGVFFFFGWLMFMFADDLLKDAQRDLKAARELNEELLDYLEQAYPFRNWRNNLP